MGTEGAGGLSGGLSCPGGAALGREPSCSPCRRQKILKEKAVPMIEGYMFEEHELIRLAATECMCNMAMSKEVRGGLGGCGVLLSPLPTLFLLLPRCRSCSWLRAVTG